MSNPSVSATIVFGLFAFLFIGVMLAAAFVIDRRRVKDVHDAIPERVEGAMAYREEELHRDVHPREVHTAAEYEAHRDEHGEAHRDQQHRHGAA
ncbi:hypothetical protein [Nocardioides ultimimeridianus]